MKVTQTVVAFVVVASLVASKAASQEVTPLWPDGAPGFEHRKDEPEQAESYWVKNIHNPSLTVYLPPAEKATGTAIVICPGGGHRELVFNAEGKEAADFLTNLGVACFVLKYRLAREKDSAYSLTEHVTQDGRRALRVVRSRADQWRVDPHRVGMLGFSAGAEVVSLVAYESGNGDANSADANPADAVEQQNGRPDFQILVYPGPIGVPESVPRDAPPALLIVSNDDRGHVEPVVDLLVKYRQARAPIEVHLFARGGHAFNMGNRSELKSVQHWPDRMAEWLQDSGYLAPARGN